MKLFREENITKIIDAINVDQYEDCTQYNNIGESALTLPTVTNFLNMFLTPGGEILEIGCGSGELLGKFGITKGIEPCFKRYIVAASKDKKKYEVKQNVAEYIDFPDKFFSGVVMLNGFFQVRSDYESLIEINRVLKLGGKFIVNILVNDNVDVVVGRCLGYKNFIRICSQFGFTCQAYISYNAGKRFNPDNQESVILAFIKERDFDERYLNLPQIKNKECLINYIPERDWRLV